MDTCMSVCPRLLAPKLLISGLNLRRSSGLLKSMLARSRIIIISSEKSSLVKSMATLSSRTYVRTIWSGGGGVNAQRANVWPAS